MTEVSKMIPNAMLFDRLPVQEMSKRIEGRRKLPLEWYMDALSTLKAGIGGIASEILNAA